MAKSSDIEVVHFEAGMVDMELRTFQEEKCVVVNLLHTPVQVREGQNVLSFVFNQVARLQIETIGVYLSVFATSVTTHPK